MYTTLNTIRQCIIGCVISISLIGSTVAFAEPATNTEQSADYSPTKLPIDDVQRFSMAISQIKNYYVEQVNDKDLFEDAIRGMLSGLDPHSSYLDMEELQDLKNHTTGEFGGLGIEVGMEEGYIRVVSPIDDTPAAKAGVKAGDLIVKLDDKPVKGMTLREAVNLMRGKKGTDIVLTIIRKNEKLPLKISVTRDVIKIKSVKSEILDDNYGYVRISHFQDPTNKNLKQAITKLNKESKGNLKGIIIDLRNNPGGLLDSAIDVSDSFLDSRKLNDNKLIVYTEGRIPGAKFEANATPGDLTNGIPIVVLINEGSASGSEIVAGALQDHKRAVLMGTETFGKGSVQTVLPLDEKRGVKLTTALYYTPLGRSIQATGIKPDVIVEDMDVAEGKDKDALEMVLLKESDFDNALQNTNGETNHHQKANNPNKNDNNQPLASKDYQLHEALNLLKGLSIVSYQK